MMSLLIRTAVPKDAKGIRDIYAPIIENTPISFETEVPSVDEMVKRITDSLKTHAYFVAEENGEIAAYAYGGFYRPRKAYAKTAETTIYVHPDRYGKGIGIKLYTHLINALTDMGFHSAVAALYVPNPASVALHKKAGFKLVGRLQQVGFKFGKWHDVEWWQRPLSSAASQEI